jgi:hypothetical protein
MKIHNVSNRNLAATAVRFLLKSKAGVDTLFTLNPGEVIYSETEIVDINLRIYERKKILKISKDAKPSNLEFFKVYSEGVIVEEKHAPKQTKDVVTEEKEEEIVQPETNNAKPEPVGGMQPIDFDALKQAGKDIKTPKSTKAKSNNKEKKSRQIDYTQPKAKQEKPKKAKTIEEAALDIEKYINSGKK